MKHSGEAVLLKNLPKQETRDYPSITFGPKTTIFENSSLQKIQVNGVQILINLLDCDNLSWPQRLSF